MSTLLIVGLLIFLAYSLSQPSEKKSAKTPGDFIPKGRGEKVTPLDRGNMIRCHNCGCFFSEARVVSKVIEGHILQFCSTNCRENFRYH
ncbi:MAG: hypothetical protein H6510_04240 [Acidobacteria bacterium]|nr:hypothetical protein [Acidobacteriota bacterium]MCB9397006.1 hypothetical protein [Acidobacteriota bacterium]